jgi:hypothetical protein
MYGLTIIKGLIKHVGLKQSLAVFAIAAFISVSALPTPAQAQGDNIFDAGFSVGVPVVLLRHRSWTLHKTVDNPDILPSEGPGVIVTGAGAPIGHVKVFSASSGALLQSYELTSLTAGPQSIVINRDDLREEGDPVTGSIQLWIQIVIAPRPAGQEGTQQPDDITFRIIFNVVDNVSGRTTARGTFTKVGPGYLLLPG